MNQLALFELEEQPKRRRNAPRKNKQGSMRKRRKATQRALFETYKSQKQQIIDALAKPMTINELYRTLPHISPKNIAPLVTYVAHENKIVKIGEKMDTTEKGIERKQVIWSARPEDVIRMGDSTFLLNVTQFRMRGMTEAEANEMAMRVANDSKY